MTRLPPITSLFSPPEATPLKSFSPILLPAEHPLSHPTSSTVKPSPILGTTRLFNSTPHSPVFDTMRILPSPPISPWADKRLKMESAGKEASTATPAHAATDPVLYPNREDRSAIPADQPLFPSEPSLAMAEELVSKHMSMHLAQFDKKFNRPTREEYLLALSCVPTLGRSYNRNPGSYMKRTREETEDQYWKAKRICAKPGTKALPLVHIAPASPPKSAKKVIKATPIAKSASRNKRTPKSSPLARLMEYSPTGGGSSATPDGRTPGTKRPEDVNYDALPDYSPPTSTLPKGNPKSLKADWPSNNLLNLSADPDRHLLHEAELNLAATLRLTCATYLCSKRRIFEARLKALKIGKEFRKTDAQQACKIDVNKASKLWTAYDKVGWFNQDYFQQYL